ncbi:TonB family protein [Undibacterium sp. Jales W-56]|uniref:energy transducer TonB n=1 Tax=Undibacterium sp. Jales W-56 TaxID=2897325 RepID=UPI0021D3CE6E|nr:energy transducer TonB [Undibacterium sp. Jales W-56]MCU6432449.1 TonB family protein [Undibacterium sp. Jales W-56]
MMFNPDYPTFSPRPATRLLPILAIVLAHVVLLYALKNGLLVKAVQVLPKEIMVSMVPISQPPPAAKPSVALPALNNAPTVLVPMPELAVATVNTANVQTASTPAEPQQLAAPADNAAPATPVGKVNAPKLITGIEYIQAPQADYPPLSRRMGEEGKVTLRVLVNEKGRAEKVEIQQSSGSNRLDEAARIAILRALFKPHIEDGKPLMMLATATISFSLNS